MTTPVYLSEFIAFAMKGLVLFGVGCGWAMFARRSSAATRHWIWSLTLSSALVLPVLSFCLPAVNISVLPATWSLAEVEVQPVAVGPLAPRVLHGRWCGATVQSDQPTQAPVAYAGRVDQSTSRNHRLAGPAVVLLWACVAACFAVRLVVDEWRMHRLSRDKLPLADPAVVKLARTLALQAGMAAPVRLGISPCLSRRPLILLPTGAEDWSAGRWRAVLLHELAHLKRRDHFWNLVGFVSLGLHWFNPLAWHAHRRLSLERERAADDWVLRGRVCQSPSRNCSRAATVEFPTLGRECDGNQHGSTRPPAIAIGQPGSSQVALNAQCPRGSLRGGLDPGGIGAGAPGLHWHECGRHFEDITKSEVNVTHDPRATATRRFR